MMNVNQLVMAWSLQLCIVEFGQIICHVQSVGLSRTSSRAESPTSKIPVSAESDRSNARVQHGSLGEEIGLLLPASSSVSSPVDFFAPLERLVSAELVLVLLLLLLVLLLLSSPSLAVSLCPRPLHCAPLP